MLRLTKVPRLTDCDYKCMQDHLACGTEVCKGVNNSWHVLILCHVWGWGLSIYFSFDPHNNPLRKAPLSSPFLQTIYRNFEKVFWLLVTAQRITVKLKTTNLYYVTVSVGQEFCGGLAVWLWLKVSHEVAVQMSVWKLGAGGSTSKLSHMVVS